MKAARPKVRQDRGDDESIARGAPLGAAAPLPRGAPPAVTRRPSGEGYANGARRVDRRPIGLRRAEQRRIVALVEHASTLGGSPRSAAVSPVCDCQGGGVPSCHGAELPQASWTTELRGTWWPYDQRHVQLRRRRAAPPAAAGGGCHRPPSEGRGDTLTLTELCFSPTVLRVAPGTRVTIVNRDQLDHPLGRPGGAWSWDGSVRDRTAVRLEVSGVYPFFCYVHPGMVGVVVVGDGRGSGGATTVDVAATESEPSADAASRPATPTASGPIEASVPPAWLVVVALAALLGALGGTRLAARRRS